MFFKSLAPVVLERLALALVMALLGALISLNRWGYSVDQAIYDSTITRLSNQIADDILIVAIDERSLLELGRWPWSRDVHAQLVDKLSEAGVKAIAFDVVFAEPDRSAPENDLRFAKAVADMGKVVLLVHMEQTHAGGQILEVLPPPELFEAAAKVGHAHIEYDVDGVTRAVFLREGLGEAFWPHAMYALWELTEPKKTLPMPGLRSSSPLSGSPFVIRRDYFNLVPMASPMAYSAILSFTDVLHDRIPARMLRDKIVIVGATAKGLGDVVATPNGPIVGVEFNANIFHSLRSSSTILPVSGTVHALLTMMVIIGIILSGIGSTPRQYLLITVAGVAAVVIISLLLLRAFNIWFAPLATIIPVLLFYPLWSWLRLEQALRFLRRELKRVESASEPNALLQLPELQRRINFLASVAKLPRWQILDADQQTQLAGEPVTGNNIQRRGLNLTENGRARACNLLWEDDHAYDQAIWQGAISSLLGEQVPDQKSRSVELVSQTINRLREANSQAEKHRAFFDQCLENLQDAVLVANLLGEVVFANARARAYFAVVGNRGDELLPSIEKLRIEGGWQAAIKRVLTQGAVYAEVQEVGGQATFFMQMSTLRWLSNEVDTLVISFTDITAVKESERVRTEALHFLSHDLRSPVVSILALLEHFRLSHPEGSASEGEINEILAEIETYARKNLSFAESFLQLARAEMVGDANFDTVDLHAVIDNAVMMTRPTAKAKNIELKVDRVLDDLWLWGDGELLERALTNLVVNAIKYSNESGSVLITVTKFAPADDAYDQENVAIAVTDQGIGISESDLNIIFQRFRRGTQPSNTSNSSGAGLGLHFVEKVCRQHGGSIEAESKLGEGSCFTMRLPLVKTQIYDH